MPQAQRIPHSTITKSDFDNNDDDLLRDLPSPFDEALNGRGRERYLSPSMQTKSSSGLLDPDAFRRLSISTVSSRSISPCPPYVHSTKPWTWRTPVYNYWLRNECMISVVVSQAFGALMNVTTRLLELEGDGMHPFQILFARMGLTCLFCCVWMWWTKVPDFPLGAKGIRGLLVARGLTGFFGIYGMYYSLLYLPVADAVVITFLAPSFASYACYLFLKEPFPRSAQYASLASLLGVVLIARPTTFFSSPRPVDTFTTSGNETANQAISSINDFPTPTSAQRLSAVLVALLGVVGSAGAFTTIRRIGERAHPLISVNYFAVWCTVISSFVLFLSKPLGLSDLTFALPSSLRQWTFLIFLGTCGFLMQYLLTRGLGGKSGGRATNLIYTNMVFALALDWMIFSIKPGWWSAVGIGMILIPAIYIAKWTTDDDENKVDMISDEEAGVATGERRGMLATDENIEGDREEEEKVFVGTGDELEALSQPGIVETPAHIRQDR